MTDDALLFIDVNKYLDLYRTDTGRYILVPLSKQADHILITRKVVDEVKRNKINETARFLTKHFRDGPRPKPTKYLTTFLGPLKPKATEFEARCGRLAKKSNRSTQSYTP